MRPNRALCPCVKIPVKIVPRLGQSDLRPDRSPGGGRCHKRVTAAKNEANNSAEA